MNRIVLSVLVVALLTVAGVAAAGMSHGKANGGVTWTSVSGAEYHTSFSVHDEAPGLEADRGIVTLRDMEGSERVTDVSCVLVSGNEAWFAGEVVYADGAFEGQVGEMTLYWVEDNGNPGALGPDMIGATRFSQDPCSELGQWRGGGLVTSGNLKVLSE